MFGEVPICNKVPVLRGHVLFMFGELNAKSDILFFITFLLAEILQIKVETFHYRIMRNYTFESSHIIPLRKYHPVQTVGEMNKIIIIQSFLEVNQLFWESHK